MTPLSVMSFYIFKTWKNVQKKGCQKCFEQSSSLKVSLRCIFLSMSRSLSWLTVLWLDCHMSATISILWIACCNCFLLDRRLQLLGLSNRHKNFDLHASCRYRHDSAETASYWHGCEVCSSLFIFFTSLTKSATPLRCSCLFLINFRN